METIKVKVVYATKDFAFIKELNLPQGTTIQQALDESKVYEKHPEIIDTKVGVWGRIKPKTTILKNADRVEIYRKLLTPMKLFERN